MNTNLMKKAVATRFRVTGTGKLMRRKMGLGHSRAKKNSRQMQRKNLPAQLQSVDVRIIRKKYF